MTVSSSTGWRPLADNQDWGSGKATLSKVEGLVSRQARDLTRSLIPVCGFEDDKPTASVIESDNSLIV